MNFQKIPPVDRADVLLEIAFRRARIHGVRKNLKGNWLEIIRKKEALKLDVIKDSIVPRLEKIVAIFPDTRIIGDFYIQLMKLTLDFGQLKKSLAGIEWAVSRISSLHKNHVRRVFGEKERSAIKEISKQCYGRIASILKQIDVNLIFLEKTRRIMLSYPDVKDLFTVCLYGFPNVGKTTLLNKITGTKAKIAAYAFTTKSINAGYITSEDVKIQVLDVPGTLARKDKMNVIEKQAQLVLDELADLVVYVFDLSEQCGYNISEQVCLFERVRDSKQVIIYLSKQDLLDSEAIAAFEKKHYNSEEIVRIAAAEVAKRKD